MRRSVTRAWYRLFVGTAPLAGAACAELTSPRQPSLSPSALSGVLSTVPLGYGDLTSSYVGTSASQGPAAGLWLGGGRESGLGRSAMMGGGLGGAFLGDVGFGRGFGHDGPFGGGLPCTGTYAASTGRVSCDPVTRNGLTVTRSAQYLDAAGAVQQAFDTATTNTVNLRTTVTGTVTFTPATDGDSGRDGDRRGRGRRPCWGDGRGPDGLLLGDTATIVSATTTVSNASDRTVTGLAKGSAQRTVNGTSLGQESTTGTSTRGQFTATRVVADTARGIVIPVRSDGRSYPTAGTVVRVMEASVTYGGEAAAKVSRREVVTYDGSATATVVITENGATRTCTRALPRGPLSCS